MAGRLSSLTSRYMAPDYEETSEDVPQSAATLALKNKMAQRAAGLQSVTPTLEAPTTPDTGIYDESQRQLQLANLVHGFTGAIPVTSYGAKLGQHAGMYTDSPAWQAVREQATNPWSIEKLRVDNANTMHSFVNQYSKLKSETDSKNNQMAIDAAKEQAIARGARGMQEASLDSQERIAHERTMQMANALGMKMSEANLKEPTDQQKTLARISYEAMDYADKLYEIGQNHGGTTVDPGGLIKMDATNFIGKYMGFNWTPRIIAGSADAQKYIQYASELKTRLSQISALRRTTKLGDDNAEAFIPPPGSEDAAFMNGLQEAKNIGVRALGAVIDTPGGALWAWNQSTPAMNLRKHVDKGILKNAGKSRSQIAREINSGIGSFTGEDLGGGATQEERTIPPMPGNNMPQAPEPPGIDEWMKQEGIKQ
jgi:hypothetical protein